MQVAWLSTTLEHLSRPIMIHEGHEVHEGEVAIGYEAMG